MRTKLYSISKIDNFNELRKLALINTRPKRVTYNQKISPNFKFNSPNPDEYYEITVLVDKTPLIKARQYSNLREVWFVKDNSIINKQSIVTYLNIFTPFYYNWFHYSNVIYCFFNGGWNADKIIKLPKNANEYIMIESDIVSQLDKLIPNVTIEPNE